MNTSPSKSPRPQKDLTLERLMTRLQGRSWLQEIVETFFPDLRAHRYLFSYQEHISWSLTRRKKLFLRAPGHVHPQGPKNTNLSPKGLPVPPPKDQAVPGPWSAFLPARAIPLTLRAGFHSDCILEAFPCVGGKCMNALKAESLSQSLKLWQRGHLHLWISLIFPAATADSSIRGPILYTNDVSETWSNIF